MQQAVCLGTSACAAQQHTSARGRTRAGRSRCQANPAAQPAPRAGAAGRRAAGARLHEVAGRASGDIVLAKDELLGHAAAQRHRHLVLQVRAAARCEGPTVTLKALYWGCVPCDRLPVPIRVHTDRVGLEPAANPALPSFRAHHIRQPAYCWPHSRSTDTCCSGTKWSSDNT